MYATNCGQYVRLNRQGQPDTALFDEVGIAFSFFGENQEPVLHRIGSKESVSKWIDKKNASFTEGPDGFSVKLFMVSGKFDLEPLNRLSENSTYFSKFLEHHNISIEPPTPTLEGPR